MRHVRLLSLFALITLFGWSVEAREARILKVLPHYLDSKGRHTLAPSLYERDAYQKVLRDTPHLRSAMRFDIQSTAPKKNQPLKLRLEFRGVKGQDLTSLTKETTISDKSWFRPWSSVEISGKDFKDLGELTAWRATLWNGEKQISEQKSFLW